MNYYEHHLGDYDGATAHLSWQEDCAYRRLICLYYRNEAPIPADTKQACRLVRASSKAERDAVQQVLSEFFNLQADGWHHKRCDADLERYHDKSRKARESVSKRWANRDANPMPTDSERNTTVDTNVSGSYNEGNTPRARPQSPDTRHQTPEEQGARPDATTLRALAEGIAEPEDPAIGAGTRYGLAARAMRQRGCAATPGDPRLRQLVDQGASLEEFEAVGAEAAEKGKGPAWALTALINRRKDAAQVQLAPTAAAPAWHETRAGVSQRGQELNLGAWSDVENESIRRGVIPSFAAYRVQVIAADKAAGGTT